MLGALAQRLAAALPSASAGPLPRLLRDATGIIPGASEMGPEPDLLGRCYEEGLGALDRRRRGAHFTPPRIADGLVAFATAGASDRPVVFDPAVGGGAFLLAAARWLERRGLTRDRIVAEHLWGLDLDPLAVDVAECALWLWSAEAGTPALVGDHVRVGDGLHDLAEGRFDLVIGNPPFQSQLSSLTARDEQTVLRAKQRFGAAARGYTDTAALFLLAALDVASEGGRVALVLPESLLVARDAGGVRTEVLRRACIEGIWVARARVFDAAVDVCAPVLEVGGRPQGAIRRAGGPSFEVEEQVGADAIARSEGASWAALLTAEAEVPSVELGSTGTLGELCTVTAGFRDQYYGLEGAVVELEGELPEQHALLVTSGLVDPGRCAWGERPARFMRQRWRRPAVDLRHLDEHHPALARWARERLVPKVVVATQTKVVEAAVDEEGRWYPSTPTLSVHPPPERLWHLCAALSAPPISAWARRRAAGAALSRDAIKLRARDLLEVPLPVELRWWDRGAGLLRRQAAEQDPRVRRELLVAAGEAMCRAYGLEGEALQRWWRQRLPDTPKPRELDSACRA